MQNVIIVHGKPSKENYYDPKGHASSNFGWIPWLQKQLLVRDIMPNVPEMPHAYQPEYETWQREFERFDVTPETTLVGHSMGGCFLLRWLSAHPAERVKRTVLVAPSLDPFQESATGFADFTIDPTITDRTHLVMLTSDTDSEKAERSQAQIRTALPQIDERQFPGYGHFIPEHTGRDDLPELLDSILA